MTPTPTPPPCDRHLADGPLTCTRADVHEPGHGCVYVSTSGVPSAPKEEL